MFTKSFITCSAMVLALGIGSAVAAEPVVKTTIMPQQVQAMTTAELETVRGTWGLGSATALIKAAGHHSDGHRRRANNPGNAPTPPPGKAP
jgi:hypothetical protein